MTVSFAMQKLSLIPFVSSLFYFLSELESFLEMPVSISNVAPNSFRSYIEVFDPPHSIDCSTGISFIQHICWGRCLFSTVCLWHQVVTTVQVYIQALYSVPLIHTSVFELITHYFCYYNLRPTVNISRMYLEVL